MNEEISDKLFTIEMKVLWQNIDQDARNKLGDIIRDYFDYGERSRKIIDKLQIKVG